MRLIVSLLVCGLMSGCVISVDADGDDEYPEKRYISAGVNAPYSRAVWADELLFVSGTLGTVPEQRGVVEGGIGPETLQAMQNISRTLADSGASMDDVVKCTVFLADMDEWGDMNRVYTTFFRDPPARSAVEVSRLALDARVEIECIAFVD
ncbi:MAG: RidA family protein [Pseudomonadota bacterium]